MTAAEGLASRLLIPRLDLSAVVPRTLSKRNSTTGLAVPRRPRSLVLAENSPGQVRVMGHPLKRSYLNASPILKFWAFIDLGVQKVGHIDFLRQSHFDKPLILSF